MSDMSTSRYQGQCWWNPTHNRNCRSKKKRMAKHIGLIRWIAIIFAPLPQLDTEEYRAMKNKAVYNFEESNHGKFVSGQIVPEFEYLKIKVWIIECKQYRWISCICAFYPLKRRCRRVGGIFVTGCTVGCQNDNIQCGRWQGSRRGGGISASVSVDMYYDNVLSRTNWWTL